LADLDLAVDAFMYHPVRTGRAHVTIPQEDRIWGFDDLELVLVANEASRGNGHHEQAMEKEVERSWMVEVAEVREELICRYSTIRDNSIWEGEMIFVLSDLGK
jgi:hypothetical protein